MQMHSLMHKGYEINVQPVQTGLGVWRTKVSVRSADGEVAEVRPEAVQPEWLTEAEAVRDGIERGMHCIERELAPDDET